LIGISFLSFSLETAIDPRLRRDESIEESMNLARRA